MIEHRLTLSDGELTEISRHIGSRWKSWGASQSTASGNYLAEKFFFATESAITVIRADLLEIAVSDYSEEIVSISIADDPEEQVRAAQRGHVYFQFNGEAVQSIQVVRDQVDRFVADAADWRLTADRGLIFEFPTGRLAICTGGDFSADFFTQMTAAEDSLEIPDFSHFWQSNLEQRFEIRRSLIPVPSLIEDR